MGFIQENKSTWVLIEENIVSRGNVKFSVYEILVKGVKSN